MAKSGATDRERALTLLRAAFGDFDASKPLSKTLSQLSDFGRFEWMLTVIGLEIELRVDIPVALSDNLRLSAEKFCERIATLPKIDSPGYTLECLGLVAQALLNLDLAPESSERQAGKASARKAATKKAKTVTRQSKTGTASARKARTKKAKAVAR